MKKKDVVIGEIYRVKKVVGGRIKIIEARESGGWFGVNIETNRVIRIKSAARLYPVKAV